VEIVKRPDLASYIVFLMPMLDLVRDSSWGVIDVEVSHPLVRMKLTLEYSACTRTERKVKTEKQKT
jgi:hypothetical protein